MKELLLQYAEYNIWANKRLIDAVIKLDDEALNKEIISSFSSVRSTVLHTWAAEYAWLQRLLLTENPVWVGDATQPFDECCREWQKVSAELKQFVSRQYDENALKHVLQYYDRKKVSHKTPVFQVLQHVFNHATYHRGQLVTMLRQLGIKDIPGTDFIGFVRK